MLDHSGPDSGLCLLVLARPAPLWLRTANRVSGDKESGGGAPGEPIDISLSPCFSEPPPLCLSPRLGASDKGEARLVEGGD